jgi:hypothetical protein
MNISDLEQINDITAKYQQQVARLEVLNRPLTRITLSVKHGEAQFELLSKPSNSKVRESSGLCDTSMDLIKSVLTNETKSRMHYYAKQLQAFGVEVNTLTAVKAA